MTRNTINEELIQQTIHFHGHSCPGLALGIRAAELALAELGRASDEEMVAVVSPAMSPWKKGIKQVYGNFLFEN